MGALADEQPALHRDPLFFQKADFVHQHHRIDDHSVADDALGVRMKDARGHLVQNDLFLLHHHRMAGVGSALIPGHDIDLCAEQIDDFAFAFIAPLGADDNRNRHNVPLKVKDSVPRRFGVLRMKSMERD